MGAAILDLQHDARLAFRRAFEESRRQSANFIVTSTRRSFLEQLRLFTLFKLGRSRFPAAPPGQSTHQLGIAVDLVPRLEGVLPVIVRIFERFGYRWAGPRDSVHFTYQGPFSSPVRGEIRTAPRLVAPEEATRTPRKRPLGGSGGVSFPHCGL